METTESQELRIVKMSGGYLKNIKEQTPAICLAAVQQDGHALAFAKEQTYELCLAAIQQNGYALKYVKEMHYELAKLSLETQNTDDGGPLQYITSRIPNHLNPDNPEHQKLIKLGWYDGAVYELSLQAVKKDGFAIMYVSQADQTLEICMEAIKENAYSFEYIINQTPKICLAAIKKELLMVTYIKDLEPVALEIDQALMDLVLNRVGYFEDNGNLLVTDPVFNAFQKMDKMRKAHIITDKINRKLEGNIYSKPKLRI